VFNEIQDEVKLLMNSENAAYFSL